MGLSRNKVAVSEGAAGSPPFYGDRDSMSRYCRTSRRGRYTEGLVQIFCCSIFRDRKRSLKKEEPVVWGCSSVGRAPALQAGGHGFESHHLHQRTMSAFTTRGSSEGNPKFIPDGKETKVPNKEQTRVGRWEESTQSNGL